MPANHAKLLHFIDFDAIFLPTPVLRHPNSLFSALVLKINLSLFFIIPEMQFFQ